MARAKGTPTLDLSPEDNDELLKLCRDNDDAQKTWLGGVLLRYGMEHPDLALAFQGTESVKRTRKRRADVGAASPEPAPPEQRKGDRSRRKSAAPADDAAGS